MCTRFNRKRATEENRTNRPQNSRLNREKAFQPKPPGNSAGKTGKNRPDFADIPVEPENRVPIPVPCPSNPTVESDLLYPTVNWILRKISKPV